MAADTCSNTLNYFLYIWPNGHKIRLQASYMCINDHTGSEIWPGIVNLKLFKETRVENKASMFGLERKFTGLN